MLLRSVIHVDQQVNNKHFISGIILCRTPTSTYKNIFLHRGNDPSYLQIFTNMFLARAMSPKIICSCKEI